jgi:hypothetical protein
LSSVDEASSFFEKVQLHFQLADLFVQLVFLGIGLLAELLAAVAEDVGQAGQRLFLPASIFNAALYLRKAPFCVPKTRTTSVLI